METRLAFIHSSAIWNSLPAELTSNCASLELPSFQGFLSAPTSDPAPINRDPARVNGDPPPKDAFYSRLNDEAITDEDYEHVKNVWKEFNIKSLREYHNL